jgi:hypothetical protein
LIQDFVNSNLTDEELITRLRDYSPTIAADRIEQLVKDIKVANDVINYWIVAYNNMAAKHANDVDVKVANDVINHWIVAYNNMAAKLAKAVDALRLVTDACDEGKMVSLGSGGMTIDAQIRRSVYNQVPAWPIEEARVVLEELENYNG